MTNEESWQQIKEVNEEAEQKAKEIRQKKEAAAQKKEAAAQKKEVTAEKCGKKESAKPQCREERAEKGVIFILIFSSWPKNQDDPFFLFSNEKERRGTFVQRRFFYLSSNRSCLRNRGGFVP